MVDWKLIQKYILGRAGAEERREIRHWMERDPENDQLIRQLEQIWEYSPEEEFEINVQEAWERFSRNQIGREQIKLIGHTPRENSGKLSFMLRSAAVILVAVLTGFFVQSFVSQNSESRETSRFYVMQDLVTGKGEKARITFSDGTEVILNAASSLRFPKKFKGSSREVHLDGEAYFKVAHDPRHPFIVRVQGTRVTVLGTEFNIRGWKEDSSVDVAVRGGKVSVQMADRHLDKREVILTGGELTRVERGEGISPVEKIDADIYLLWTRGGMHFDNVPVRQVLKHLERKFDVEISAADTTLLDVPFTSTFRQAELNEILYVLGASLKMEYTREGSQIVFK